jgi:hypothetical protein
MRPEDVPAEWVEAGKRAHTIYPIPLTIPAKLPTRDEAWELQIRWILAAVAPAIALAEREACAKMADEQGKLLRAFGEQRIAAGIPITHPLGVAAYQLRALAADDIAAAIRARTGEPT